jgi:hypothetical protein
MAKEQKTRLMNKYHASAVTSFRPTTEGALPGLFRGVAGALPGPGPTEGPGKDQVKSFNLFYCFLMPSSLYSEKVFWKNPLVVNVL